MILQFFANYFAYTLENYKQAEANATLLAHLGKKQI